MDHARRMRRDVAWNLVPVVLLAVIGLALNFAIAGHWGAEALGVFNLVTTAMFSAAVLGAGGLQFAVLKSVAEAPDDDERVAKVVVGALVPTLVLAGLTTLLFVVIRAPLARLVGAPSLETGVLWVAPGLFAFAVNKILLGVVNGLRRMRAFAIYTSLRYLLIGVGLAYALATDLAAERLPVIWTISECGLLLVLGFELFGTVALRRGGGWGAWARTQIDYGARSVLSTLVWEINSKLDIWVVGIVMSERELGIYSLASVVYEGALQIPVVVQNNVNPLIAKHVAAGELVEVEGIVRRSRRWFVPAMIGACALGAVLYPYVIPWLTGNPEFGDGALAFAILMGGIALSSAYLPFNQALLMAGQPGWHSAYIVMMVGVAASALAILTPRYGIDGAAIGTAIGLVGSAVLLRQMVRWRVGIRI